MENKRIHENITVENLDTVHKRLVEQYGEEGLKSLVEEREAYINSLPTLPVDEEEDYSFLFGEEDND